MHGIEFNHILAASLQEKVWTIDMGRTPQPALAYLIDRKRWFGPPQAGWLSSSPIQSYFSL